MVANKKELRRFEILVTLECPWGCTYCYRGLDQCSPKGSHVTPDQINRLISYFRQHNFWVSWVKINGGEPACNPHLEEICRLLLEARPEVFGRITIYTAYTTPAFRKLHEVSEEVHLFSTPQQRPGYKAHHIPFFLSPLHHGLLQPDAKPAGSSASKRDCRLQSHCGRAFSAWGFSACAFEWTLGKVLDIDDEVSNEFKYWANPKICLHCPVAIHPGKRQELIEKAQCGEIPSVSPVFNMRLLVQKYEELRNKPRW